MSQTHLEYKDRVNLGSYYTPPKIVQLAWELIEPYVDSQTTIIDTACGYGDFLIDYGQAATIGCDIDEDAIEMARKNTDKVLFFRTNSLHNISREKLEIPQQSTKLIVVGNPPYNDKTSLIRHKIKQVDFEVDEDIGSRDLGISFLRSYNKLAADFVCVLHPLSYLIKPTNFRHLKEFTANYKLIDGILISSGEFPESAKHTPFPIIIAFYQRDNKGMEYNYIRSFPFRIGDGLHFCLSDFDYITNYIRKYPSKQHQPVPGDSLFFWTIRDINALKRNRTFVQNYSSNTIVLDKTKLDYYAYVDVFKRNLYRLPFYFGNCDVPIDDALFKQYKHCFISDAIRHHPFLEKHFQINPITEKVVESKIDMYFRELLGKYHQCNTVSYDSKSSF
ncbi:SAM-dependent methyltransferase [Candidatus Poribacteria bacterium]|nr:MAG: SAM-dependent methyltransferase [Candidatus Poribacteria bacterium]